MSARRRTGLAPRPRPVPPARPGHAGGLPLWERLTFAVVFALMLIFVIVIALSSARGGHGSGPGAAAGPGNGGRSGASPAVWNRRLASALAPVLRGHTGHLAVGVVDETTGARAVYDGHRHFHTGSLVKADILATVLLREQRSGQALSADDQQRATEMIENSDNDAATDLWRRAGAAAGLTRANATLGLRHTVAGRGGYWGLTSTTAGDQLRLLEDLTLARSPLNSASRAYELRLMAGVEADQRWGVSAAASPGTLPRIKNAWLPDPRLWVLNSIGVVRHRGQRLLLVVLSNDQPSEAAGIAQDEKAAIAAAAMITEP